MCLKLQPSLSFIQLQVRIGDTVCYRFRPDDNDSSDGGGTVRISYLGLGSVYNVVNAYDFSLAAAEVRCLCNCPGGANTCDANTQRWELGSVLGPKLMVAKSDKHYPNRSGQTSLATAVANVTKSDTFCLSLS